MLAIIITYLLQKINYERNMNKKTPWKILGVLFFVWYKLKLFCVEACVTNTPNL